MARSNELQWNAIEEYQKGVITVGNYHMQILQNDHDIIAISGQ